MSSKQTSFLLEQVKLTLESVQETCYHIRILSDYSGITNSTKSRLLSTAEHLDDILSLLLVYYEDELQNHKQNC